MTDIQINPIALIVIGWSLYWMKKQKVNTSSIVGECLGIVFWLALFPILNWAVVKYFDWEVVSFWVYFRFMMMVMVGRVVCWVRWW